MVIPLAWLVVGWSTGRVLGRLTELAQTSAERGTDSTEPIPIESTPTEAHPLVAAMNVLIDRLQQALDLQRRFVADAAHQLRTPLSALHLQIENLGAAAKEGDLAFPASELEKLHSAGLRAPRAASLIDKHVDHPRRVVLSDVVIQILGKQNALSTDFTLEDEARHLTPPARIIQNYNSTGVFTQPR